MTKPGQRELAVRVVAPEPRFFLAQGSAPTAQSIARDAWPDIPGSLLQLLEAGPIGLAKLENTVADQLTRLYLLLEVLWRERALILSDHVTDPSLSVAPTVHDVTLTLGEGVATGRWRLSRFAYLRRSEGGQLQIETPKRPVRITALKPSAAAAIAALGTSSTAKDISSYEPFGLSTDEAVTQLTLLRIGGAIEPCDEEGVCLEDRNEALMQWEFHDLLFHSRSRMGRHSEPMGGLFRFKHKIEPQPATKPNPWAVAAIMLPRPDLAVSAVTDPPFTAVLEARQSIRDQDFARPITLAQIGEFLFRTARIRGRMQTTIGEVTLRPYPGGGAGYELELYLTVNACRDLIRGVYYYDPEAHSLCFVCSADAEVEALLDDAWLSAARLCRPQILITINSRFQRLSWKYSGMAYATQLKNVGVLYQTFYLVATAMGLGGCALGLGNADRMARLAGTDYFSESSVGEFMLGTVLGMGSGS